MRFTFIDSVLQRLSPRWPLLLYAGVWTTLLTVMVAIASFAPEVAFVAALNPTSSFAKGCYRREFVRLPMDIPNEVFCTPSWMFKRSKMDLLVPPIFAAVIVASSAYAVKAFGLWETNDDHQY